MRMRLLKAMVGPAVLAVLMAVLTPVGVAAQIDEEPAAEQRLEPDAPTSSLCAAELAQLSPSERLGVSGKGEIRIDVEMSKGEAKKFDRLTAKRNALDIELLREEALAALGENLVSVTWSSQQGVEIRVKEPSEVGGHLRNRLSTHYRLGRDFRILPVKDGMSEVVRTELMASLAPRRAWLETMQIERVYSDEFCGLIIFESTSDNLAAVRDQLSAEFGLDQIEVRPFAEEDRAQILTDRSTAQTVQKGGLEIQVGIDGQLCTSNIPWYKKSGRTFKFYLVTAAHCVPTDTWSVLPQNYPQLPGGREWWTAITANVRFFQGGVDLDTGVSSLRFGAEMDLSITPFTTVVVPGTIPSEQWHQYAMNSARSKTTDRTAVNHSSFPWLWHDMSWWQWSPNWNTSTSGGDAVGDEMCQSGRTTAKRAIGSSFPILSCGMLITRDAMYSLDPDGPDGPAYTSWMYSMRVAASMTRGACTGDSGGTVWRNGGANAGEQWLAGIVSAGFGSGQVWYEGLTPRICFDKMNYSHIARLYTNLGLSAPTTMF